MVAALKPQSRKENLIGSSEWTTPLITAVTVWVKQWTFKYISADQEPARQNKHVLFSSQVWRMNVKLI